MTHTHIASVSDDPTTAADLDPNREYVLVTEYFAPDTASTGVLMTDLAVGLRRRGLDLSVLTSQPNYHSGENERQPRRSVHGGVPVRRIRAPQLRQSSLPRRLFNWTVFTLVAALTLLVSSPPRGRDRELLFVSNPPFLPPAMWLVARLRGWDYTYVVYDLYPDNMVELGFLQREGFVVRVWSWVHRRVFRAARAVVALGPVMRGRIARVAGPGFDAGRVAIVHNWQDGSFVVPRDKTENWFSAEHGVVDRFTLVYSGNIGTFHDLDTLVEAAARVDDPDVHFLVIGEGDNRRHVRGLADELGLVPERVTFLPYQDWEDLPYSLTAGDVMVVTVQEGFEGLCVSSKLYTAMATGRPVLCIAQPDSDEARIVEGFDAGQQVAQGDTGALVAAVDRWRSDPAYYRRQAANARRAFDAHFTRDEAVDAYYALLTRGPSAVSDVTPAAAAGEVDTPGGVDSEAATADD
jgi:glycosyltransferase involved in cell wall biosynthesis